MRATLTMLAIALAPASLADEAQLGAYLDIELNAAAQSGAGCQLSFLALNGTDHDIDKAVFETVLFDTSGQVMQLTLFDLGDLPSARPRVRQFVLPGLTCSGIGQVLFNGAQTCEGENLPEGTCTKGLNLRTRTDIKVLG